LPRARRSRIATLRRCSPRRHSGPNPNAHGHAAAAVGATAVDATGAG